MQQLALLRPLKPLHNKGLTVGSELRGSLLSRRSSALSYASSSRSNARLDFASLPDRFMWGGCPRATTAPSADHCDDQRLAGFGHACARLERPANRERA